jgi:hypothetical protein
MVNSQKSRYWQYSHNSQFLISLLLLLLARMGARIYLGTCWLRSGNISNMPTDIHVTLLYPHVHCQFLLSRPGALTCMLHILYNVLVRHPVCRLSVITGIGSIRPKYAPTGEPCPSRIKLQKISQQQMVLYIYIYKRSRSQSVHNFILQVKKKVVHRLPSCFLSLYMYI